MFKINKIYKTYMSKYFLFHSVAENILHLELKNFLIDRLNININYIRNDYILFYC